MTTASHFQVEDYKSYRAAFFLRTILPFFLVPIAISLAVIHLLSTHTAIDLSPRARIALHILSIPLANALLIVYTDAAHKRLARRLGARLIPRVRSGWPGNIDMLFKMMTAPKKSYIMQSMEDMMKAAGSTTVNMRLFWGDQIFTIDEGVVKFVLATGFEHFDKGVRQKEMMETFLGNGIFNRDGETWRTHRAMTRPFFARERISDFEHFEKYAAKTLAVLENDVPPGEAVDVQDLFARFTLDTAGAFLFNTPLDTLSLPLPLASTAEMGPKGTLIAGQFGAFATAFEAAQQVIVDRSRRRMLWALYELLGDRTAAPVRAITEWLDPIVERTLEEKKRKRESGAAAGDGDDKEGEETSFLEYLAASTDDKKMIREELLNILLASRDTTASLLTSVIYLMTQHPDVLARLRSEILDMCPDKNIPTYDDLRAMKYLRAVLNETLRLFPPVPGNTRASRHAPVLIPTSPSSDWGHPKDTRPMLMPAETNISYSPITIHKRKDLWGEDADEFDPLRWLSDEEGGKGRLEKMVKNPLMFVPFNAGPRICLGQQFALNEASFLLVRLLQVYDGFELALDAQPAGSLPPPEWRDVKHGRAAREKVWYASALTMYVKGGLWVRFKKADA